MIVWKPAETAPKDRDIFIAYLDGDEATPARWDDGSGNYYRRAGWYEYGVEILCARPLNFRWWADIPRCTLTADQKEKQ